MKKLSTLLFMVYTMLSVYSQDAVLYKLPVGTVPNIDGEIDTIWNGVESFPIKKAKSAFDLPTPLTSEWKATWNDTALFVLIKFNDDDHCDKWCSGTNEWETDRAEIYFDVNDTLKDNLGPSVVGSGHLQITSGFEQNATQFKNRITDWSGNVFTYAYKISGNDVVYEYVIPFYGLKDKNKKQLDPATIDTIGFDVTILDRDKIVNKLFTASWNNNVTNNWNSMDNAGKVVLKSSNSQRISLHNSGSTIKNNSTINFGYVTSGIKKDTTISITNAGSADLTLTSITATGTGFSVVQPADMVLSLNETKKIKISILDNSVGLKSGKITIVSNDPVNPTYTINLSAGINITPVIENIVSGKWVKSKSPYYVYNDLVIQEGTKLEIEPGVLVKFQGYYLIDVKGCLAALGKLGDSIRFTINDTTGFSNFNSRDGSWYGITSAFNSTRDTIKFDYCIFDHAKLAGDNLVRYTGPVISVYYINTIQISNCVFRNNFCRNDGGAVSIYASNGVITNTIFNNNIALYDGGGLAFHYGSKFKISNCKFINNKASSGGGIAINGNSNGVIYNSIISNNVSTNVGGGLNIVTSNCYIINNIISNNESLSEGGGVAINNCRPTFYNNNICFNKSYLNSSGLLIWDISPAIFINNIFWGNSGFDGSKYQMNISSGQPTFVNCIIEKGYSFGVDKLQYKGDTSSIYNVNPKFIYEPTSSGKSFNALNADWHVDLKSFVINNGMNVSLSQFGINNDYYGKSRILHSVIDIGAVETHIKTSNVSGVIISDTVWVADTIKVVGDLLLSPKASLVIAPGTVVEFQGHYKFRVHSKIKAVGLPNAMIKFTVKDTTGFADLKTLAGSWNGISINNSYWDGANYKIPDQDSMIFDHVIIEFAKNPDDRWDKTVGGGFQIKYFSKIRISNSIIRNNLATNGSGISIDGFSSPVILNNEIYNNRTLGSGGGIFVGGNSNPLIENNYISNNSGEGGLCINTSNPTVINNLISNNKSWGYGGGIMIYSSDPILSNNTIVNNYAAWEGGGICIFDCNPIVYNSILWGNKAELRGSALNTRSNPVIYNCIIENGTGGLSPATVENYNTVTESPSFIKAITDVGLSDNANLANWQINSFSSAINKAIIPPFALPLIDISGKSRVNAEKPDIGAYENQDAKLEFTKQPVGNTLCVGESISLTVEASDTAKYQWQKDGTDINGATSKSYSIGLVKEGDEGNYSCIISNSYGKIFGNPAFIKIRTAPEIIEQPKGELVGKESATKLQVIAEGSKPFAYNWKKDNLNLSDTTNVFTINNFKAVDEGVYKCTVKNSCGSATTSDISLYMAPSICMVSVTSPDVNSTPYNTIIWEKESKVQYSKYAIYRESTVAGFYDRIGTVNSSNACIFRDTLVDPREQSFLYKITGIKSDNSETDINLCNFHKTIHLLVTANLQGYVQLDWDQYIGFPYSTYYIYRSIKGKKFEAVDSISTSSRTWTDLNYKFNGDTVYYFVSIKKADPCYPSGTSKAGGDIFDQSVSNIEDNRLRSGVNIEKSDLSELEFKSYPNPCIDKINISYNLKASSYVIIEIYNELGKLINIIANENQKAGYHDYNINTGQIKLPAGVYTIRLKANNSLISRKLIKM